MRSFVLSLALLVALCASPSACWPWSSEKPALPAMAPEEMKKLGDECEELKKEKEANETRNADSPSELREVAQQHAIIAEKESEKAKQIDEMAQKVAKEREEREAAKKAEEDAKKVELAKQGGAMARKKEEEADEKAKREKEKAAEKKAAEDKAAEKKAAEDKAAQDKAAQDKAAEDKAAQDKAAQDKAAQDKAALEKAGGGLAKAAKEAEEKKKEEEKKQASEELAKKQLQQSLEERRKKEAEQNAEEQKKEAERRKNAPGSYLLTLKNIYLSHGKLEPVFSPDEFNYVLNLQNPHDQLAITPEIYKGRPEYAGGESHLPLVEMLWDDGTQNAVIEPVAVAIRRQIDLRDDGEDMGINVRVVNPFNDQNFVNYHILVKQSSLKLTLLKGLEASDENGNIVQIDPLPSRDVVTYSAFVNPETRTLIVRPDCISSWVTIDGQTVVNKQPYTILRDLKRHVQIVEVSCGRGQKFWRDVSSVTYFLKIVSDYAKEAIPMPRLIVEGVGKECRKSAKAYSCPDPEGGNSTTQLLGIIEPRIRYTIQSPDNKIEVRILDQIPTVPFTYRSDLVLKATAGRYTREWPLKFNVPMGGGFLGFIGTLLGLCLGILLLSQVIVLALSSLLGMGLPVGITEISSILTLTLQYFCYSNTFSDGGLFDNTTKPLRLFTLFFPLPWDSGTHTVGDVKDLANAYGCIFWCGAIMLATLIAHGIAALKFVLFERSYTYPHSLKFGGLESRVINWLIFPLITASSICLSNRNAEVGWKVVGGLALFFVSLWLFVSWGLLRSIVRDHKAVWIWKSSSREDGDMASSSGYWSDAVCDQLNTQPATRSFFPCIEWQWCSTVADIESVNIAPEIFSRHSEYGSETEYSSVRQSLRSNLTVSPQAHPMAKNPKSIEVVKARSPAKLCPGQRLMVGLLRTQWLDTVMTFRSLTLLNDLFPANTGDDCSIPLVVKTNQLQGPLTSGAYSFFFDGAKVPFVKICDSLARIFLGVCIGIALSTVNTTLATTMFGIIALVSIATLIYFSCTCPYSRSVDNWLYGMAMIAISISSLIFMGTKHSGRQPSNVADFFLGIFVIVALCMAVYSIVVSLSLYSSILCPPLPESRFIERLSNCTVNITDHSRGLTAEVPGWSKYTPKHVKAYSTFSTKGPAHVSLYATGEDPVLEFSFDDLRNAYRTDSLRAPLLCLYAASSSSPLRYIHQNIFDKGNTTKAATEFLSREHATRGIAADVARALTRQLEGLGGKSILVAAILSAKNAPYDASTSYSSSTSGTTASSREEYEASCSSSYTTSASASMQSSRSRYTPSNSSAAH